MGISGLLGGQWLPWGSQPSTEGQGTWAGLLVLKLAAAQCWEGSGWACSAALLQALAHPLGKDRRLQLLVGAREKGAVLYMCSSAASIFACD